MANIICFGDSNTWGTAATQTLTNGSLRYDNTQRWTALLQQALKGQHCIIEEGQPSRSLVHNPPFDGNKSGIRYLKACLAQYSPNLVIVVLGTNDLKNKFSLTADEICQGLETLVEQTLNYTQSPTNTATKILIVCPPVITEVGHYAKMYAGGAEKSKQLTQLYQACAKRLSCDFFDAGSVICSSTKDGIHWGLAQHRLLVDALLPIVRPIINDI